MIESLFENVLIDSVIVIINVCNIIVNAIVNYKEKNSYSLHTIVYLDTPTRLCHSNSLPIARQHSVELISTRTENFQFSQKI